MTWHSLLQTKVRPLTNLVYGHVPTALRGGPVVGVHLDVRDLHGYLVLVGAPQVMLSANHAVLGHAVAWYRIDKGGHDS